METDEKILFPLLVTIPKTVNKQAQPRSAEQQQIICWYCKKKQDMSLKIVGKQTTSKEQERQGEKQTTKRPNVKTYPWFPHCWRTNYPADMYWNGQSTANRPKMYETDIHNDLTDKSLESRMSKLNAPTSSSRFF